MCSAFSQLFFLILCSHRFFNERTMCYLDKSHLRITIIIINDIKMYNSLNHDVVHMDMNNIVMIYVTQNLSLF